MYNKNLTLGLAPQDSYHRLFLHTRDQIMCSVSKTHPYMNQYAFLLKWNMLETSQQKLSRILVHDTLKTC
ncbi:hypothetical protein Hanom_Chr09g00800271 [Helianthus anomalus]